MCATWKNPLIIKVFPNTPHICRHSRRQAPLCADEICILRKNYMAGCTLAGSWKGPQFPMVYEYGLISIKMNLEPTLVPKDYSITISFKSSTGENFL